MDNLDMVNIKLRGLEDPFFFTKTILGYDKLVERVHRPIFDFVQQKGVLLDLEPRDTFKTTCISIGYITWRIVKNPDIRFLLNHKVLKKSKEIIGTIKQQFEKNEKLRSLYGNFVGRHWGSDSFTVAKRTQPIREPTVTPGAVDHEITSSHYDEIINDDLAGLKDMWSLAEREAVLRYYNSLKFLRDKGTFEREINIGTRWHITDIASHIMTITDKVRVVKALLPDGTSYFPERYSAEDLIAEQKEDPIFFSSQRMNEPRALDNQLYDINKMSFYNFDSFKPDYVIGYIDPAFGMGNSGEPCFFCMVIGAVVNDKIYILEWILNRQSTANNTLLAVNKTAEYGLKQLGFESNAAQSVWGEEIQRKLRTENIISSFVNINHTTNKDRRIQAMHGAVLNSVLFRDDWADVYPEGMNQLLLYPQHKFKDGPDALEGLISMIQLRKRPSIMRL